MDTHTLASLQYVRPGMLDFTVGTFTIAPWCQVVESYSEVRCSEYVRQEDEALSALIGLHDEFQWHAEVMPIAQVVTELRIMGMSARLDARGALYDGDRATDYLLEGRVEPDSTHPGDNLPWWTMGYNDSEEDNETPWGESGSAF